MDKSCWLTPSFPLHNGGPKLALIKVMVKALLCLEGRNKGLRKDSGRHRYLWLAFLTQRMRDSHYKTGGSKFVVFLK